MGSTYLELTNSVIRRINEVELSQSNFLAAKGMQAVCKDAVRDSIAEINQQDWDWPYHAVQISQPLVVGVTEYSWPNDFKSVDWNTFQITRDVDLNVESTHLNYVDRDEWYDNQRDIDDDNSETGIRVPQHVFKAHGLGFGVSPSPDKIYNLEYRYYRRERTLSAYDDRTDIPEDFTNVIIMGALTHMNLFRENQAGVDIAAGKFKSGIKSMYNILVGIHGDHMRDTRVSFGGNWLSSDNGAYHL
jgi:hypothetical protein